MEPVLVLARVTRVLEDLQIPYLIGGSIASSVFGAPRSTQDADIVADMAIEHVEPLAGELDGEFFLDPAAIRDAIRERSSFNILDRATMFKIDMFVSPDDEWSRERLVRARAEAIRTAAGDVHLRFSTPEDTVLHKLVWFKLGGEISDRQWEDVVGLLRVQGKALEFAYMDRWSPVLGVDQLLVRARKAVSEP